MNAIFPGFPGSIIDCFEVRNIISDGKYIIIFKVDGTHIKSVPLDHMTRNEIEVLAVAIQRQVKRCIDRPVPEFEV
jgi:hypothetical protein